MKNNSKHLVIFSLLFIFSLFSACKTFAPKDKESHVVFLIKNQTGNEAECILIQGIGNRTFLTGYAIQDAQLGWTVDVEKIYWFSNWQNGWTEATVSSTGSLYVTQKENFSGWAITILETPKMESTQSATIRYRDTLLTGTDAQLLFERRLNRITETVALLHQKLPKNLSQKDFYKMGGQFLFPEVYNYPNGITKTKKGEGTHIKAEGIVWDIAYTKAAFPTEFTEIRNSGTLFRDWEETRSLYYFLYNWEN